MASTYHEGTLKEIWNFIEEWEAELNKQPGNMETDVKEAREMVSGSKNTHGGVTQYKQTLFLYWSMKSLLGKALK